jgi:hypothetical protein
MRHMISCFLQGDWCQVNPNTCLGYYGVYTSANGSDVFYDYCGPVRGVCPSDSRILWRLVLSVVTQPPGTAAALQKAQGQTTASSARV